MLHKCATYFCFYFIVHFSKVKYSGIFDWFYSVFLMGFLKNWCVFGWVQITALVQLHQH